MVSFRKRRFENGTDDIRDVKVWVLGGWDPYNKLRMNQENTEAKALKSVEIFDPSLASPSSPSSLLQYSACCLQANAGAMDTWRRHGRSPRIPQGRRYPPPLLEPSPADTRPAVGCHLRRSIQRTSAAGLAVRVLRGRAAG